MKITINIIKKHLFVFILLILISAGIFIVFAYNSDFRNEKDSSPAIFGCSANEIEVNINRETKTLQEALDFLTKRINTPNSNNLTYLGSFRGVYTTFFVPLKYIGEKNYKYIIIADVYGGGPNELIRLYIDGNLVAGEGEGGGLPCVLSEIAKTRIQFNVNKDISDRIVFQSDCPAGGTCNHPAGLYDAWVYRISEEQKFEQFSFPKVDYIINIP